jgi:hypothetical protein
MTKTRERSAQLALVAVVAGATLIAPAAHAKAPVKSGTTTVTLSPKASKKLKRDNVKLRAAKPAKRTARSYRLPVRPGRFDYGKQRGTVAQKGRLRFTHGRRKVVLKRIKITLGKRSKATAKIGGRTVKLAVLSKRGSKVRNSSASSTVSKLKVRLSKRAAKLLDRRLRTKVFSARAKFATTSVKLNRAANAGAPGPGATPPQSQAKIGLSPGLMGALASAGLEPSALPGSELAPDGSLVLPIASSTIDPQTGTGTVQFSGGLQLGTGDDAVTIENPSIEVGANQQDLFASVNGVRVKLAQLEGIGLPEALQGGLAQLNGALTLTPEGAALLNQLGGVSLFLPGTPFGDLDITVPEG